MPKFTDKTGQEWLLEITIGDLRPLAEAGLNFGKAGASGEAMAAAIQAIYEAEPWVLGQCFWLLCGEQAEKLQLSPEQFAKRFDGPTVGAAMEALAQAVVGFFPLKKTADSMSRSLTRLFSKLDADNVRRLEETVAAAEARLASPTANGSNDAAGNSPASSASTPGP